LLTKGPFKLENQSFLESSLKPQAQLDRILFDRDPQQLSSPEMLSGQKTAFFLSAIGQRGSTVPFSASASPYARQPQDLVKN